MQFFNASNAGAFSPLPCSPALSLQEDASSSASSVKNSSPAPESEYGKSSPMQSEKRGKNRIMDLLKRLNPLSTGTAPAKPDKDGGLSAQASSSPANPGSLPIQITLSDGSRRWICIDPELINRHNSDGLTLLTNAVIWGEDEVARAYVDHNANVAQENKDGFDAATWAAYCGRREILKNVLLPNLPNLDDKTKNRLERIAVGKKVTLACRVKTMKDKNDIIQRLDHLCAALKSVSLDSTKKLHIVPEMVRLVQSWRALGSTEGTSGNDLSGQLNRMLHQSAFNNNPAGVWASRFLGAKKVDDGGNTLLHHLARGKELSNVEETVDLLLASGDDINLKNKDGNTALALAIESGSIEMARLLLKKSARIDDINGMGGNGAA